MVAWGTMTPLIEPDFYARLEPFTHFSGITEDRYFRPLPADWLIFITDVKGSTKAIEAHRYKDVNTLGAASITVVRNVFKGEFPFVFGGDGATMALPPHAQGAATDALGKLQHLARTRFGMELRTGCVPVGELLGAGDIVEVAKHQICPGSFVAAFRGAGLARAEKWIKQDGSKYCFSPPQEVDIDLKGLSCRWNPIPAQRGKSLTLMVVARNGRREVYQDVLGFLNEIFDGNLDGANPVNPSLMHYKSLRQCVADESRYATSHFSIAYAHRLFEILVAVLIFGRGWPNPFFDTGHYSTSMRTHADHRKFDDVLRMVLDATPEQIARISRYLEGKHAGGELFYGLHESSHALMTCFVEDIGDGGHIHFIDGGDGGYALAARQMKEQMLEVQSQERDKGRIPS